MIALAETTTLIAHDGLKLHGIRWQVQNPKACVMLVHGVGEHSGRYEHVAAYLNLHGYTVYSLDYRGHGLSEGERANVGHFALPAEDVKTCWDWLHSEEGDTPVTIFGHSQGTLVTLLFVLCYPQAVQGVILSATMLGMAKLSPPLVWLATVLKMVVPRLKLIAIESSTISRDPAVRLDAKTDPLNHNQRLTPHIFYEMIHESRRVLQQLPALIQPILIMHGTADKLVPPAGSQMVYDAVGSTDKTLTWYDGLYHEICNEPEQEQVFADMVAWLDDHLA